MELLVYASVTFAALVFSLNGYLIKNAKAFFAIWYTVYIWLVLTVRNEFDVDINTYADAMLSTSLSFYYIKEPVIWLGQRYLYQYTQDTFSVFVIYDAIVGIILYHALRNFKAPQYAFFSILIFFPFILGMQNIYRQWVASIIFLCCFSYVWNQRHPFLTYVLFVVSVLAHNSAAIFLPLLLVRKRRPANKIFWILSFAVSFFGIYLGAETKSDTSTGANLSAAYLGLLLFIVCAIVLLDKGVFRKDRLIEYKTLISLFSLALFATYILRGSGSERVSMFCLLVAYPILVNLFEVRFRQKFPVRAAYTALGFAPMFMFSVSAFILE